jgi:hypothetical protein
MKFWKKELGLLLSCYIIKAGSGILIAIGMKVETKEGEGTVFVIHLST